MKKIEFIPNTELAENIISYPEPAKKFLPEWYKNIGPYATERKVPILPKSFDSNQTAKRCMPFFDTLTSGYMFTLSADAWCVDEKEYENRVIWTSPESLVGTHSPAQVNGMPTPENHNLVFKWFNSFIIKTPPGYSCLFMHPNHRYDLPFITLTGIVDTDTYNNPVSFPFFLKDDFMGKIPQGTPIAQVIPFKRDSWKGVKGKFDIKRRFDLDNFFFLMEKAYRNNFWQRKNFN